MGHRQATGAAALSRPLLCAAGLPAKVCCDTQKARITLGSAGALVGKGAELSVALNSNTS